MVNFNGLISSEEDSILASNRGFLYGDGIFDTLKICTNKVLFLEEHYFRLMAGMRIVRMNIPLNFTMEYFEEQLLNTAKANNCGDSSRARITFFRNEGGYYLPETNEVSFVINVRPLESKNYFISDKLYEVDLYKDFFIAKQLLSTIKSTNKMTHILGSIFANENGFQNCLLLNQDKSVIEALEGNLFMLAGCTLITPPISDGCLNGIMRKNIITIAKTIDAIQVIEETISPFDLQKADELFITNVIRGIQPITKYRKKEYGSEFAHELLKILNHSINSN